MLKRQTILLLLMLLCIELQAQSVNDCSGAIVICGDGAIASNADGIGVQEVTGNSCSSEEHNSLWLYIEITKAGTLGFNLIPTNSDINVDYDFFVFGPNATCNNLGYTIRCSTTNPNAAGATNNFTGMSDSETDTSEGPGAAGNSFVKSLDVQPGESYFIVIDRPIGFSPFELEWTGTATQGSTPFPEGPIVNQPNDLEKCNAGGTAEFDLFSTQDEITSQPSTSISYHESLADAVDNLNPITNSYSSSQSVKTIYTRVVNDITGCYEIVDFDLIILPGPDILPEYTLEACDLDFSGEEDFNLSRADLPLLNGLSSTTHQVKYYASLSDAKNDINELNAFYNASEAEIYARVWQTGEPECYNISKVGLQLNLPPKLTAYSIVQPKVNANSNSVSLEIENSGEYEYSIGNIDGPYQESTTFYDVPSGFQMLYIRDKKGCAIISTEIAILGYDNFFTPNGDGINDHWQINGIAEAAGNNLIFIFDRYGKLLKKLNTSERGWDGNSNGQKMPADDYWFRVQLQNGQEFNGHFSLKR